MIITTIIIILLFAVVIVVCSSYLPIRCSLLYRCGAGMPRVKQNAQCWEISSTSQTIYLIISRHCSLMFPFRYVIMVHHRNWMIMASQPSIFFWTLEFHHSQRIRASPVVKPLQLQGVRPLIRWVTLFGVPCRVKKTLVKCWNMLNYRCRIPMEIQGTPRLGAVVWLLVRVECWIYSFWRPV